MCLRDGGEGRDGAGIRPREPPGGGPSHAARIRPDMQPLQNGQRCLQSASVSQMNPPYRTWSGGSAEGAQKGGAALLSPDHDGPFTMQHVRAEPENDQAGYETRWRVPVGAEGKGIRRDMQTAVDSPEAESQVPWQTPARADHAACRTPILIGAARPSWPRFRSAPIRGRLASYLPGLAQGVRRI